MARAGSQSRLSDSLFQKLTVGDNLSAASINALPENNRPFQIIGTCELGRFALIVSLSSVSLFNMSTGATVGSIPWQK